MADEIKKVAVYFIGTDYPPNIGELNYNVRGKTYRVARRQDGSPDVGAAIEADVNDVNELVSKARYFNGKVNVEVFTTDAKLAGDVKKAFDSGKRVPVEARMVGVGGDVVVAPSKEEILELLSDAEIEALLRKRGKHLPENLSTVDFVANADASSLARAAAVEVANRPASVPAPEPVVEAPETAAQRRAKEKATKDQVEKLLK